MFTSRYAAIGYIGLKNHNTGLIHHAEIGRMWLDNKDDKIEVNKKMVRIFNCGATFIRIEERYYKITDKSELSKNTEIYKPELGEKSGLSDNAPN